MGDCDGEPKPVRRTVDPNPHPGGGRQRRKPRRGGCRRREDNHSVRIEDRGSKIEDRVILFDPRSSIECPSSFCARPGYASLPACSLGERRIDWKRCAPEPYCLPRPIIARKHPRPYSSALSPPNALLSETHAGSDAYPASFSPRRKNVTGALLNPRYCQSR
jgi:hypothetical protein